MRLPFGYIITRLKPRTAIHPDLKSLTEYAFSIGKNDYYTFKNTGDMPARRFQKANEFMREAELRMTAYELGNYLNVMEAAINKGKMNYVAQMISLVRSRSQEFIEIDTFYRLFSCMFFTLEEDVTDYDYDLNDIKIEEFKSEKPEDFFFTKPLRDYLPQTDISKEDLKAFSKVTKIHKDALDLISSKIMKELTDDGLNSGGK